MPYEQSTMQDKVALITGGGGGIGRACGLALAKLGVKVAVADICFDKAQQVVEEIRCLGQKGMAIQVDMASVKQIRLMVESLITKWSRIDILVNNAGVYQRCAPEEVTEKDWDRILDVNLKGTFFCSQSVVLYMKKQGGGRIINIASVTGVRGATTSGIHYAASKAGIISLTKSLARYGAPYGILVNAVAPGYITTDMIATANYQPENVPLGRLGTPEEVANVVVFLASPASSYITGHTININGGIYI